jgi:uncharacterized protein YlbG (UPF0298 family)
MPIITIRISEEEKKKLESYGNISKITREAIKFYINSKRTQKTIRKLKQLQEKHKLKTSAEDDLMLIKEDRER